VDKMKDSVLLGFVLLSLCLPLAAQSKATLPKQYQKWLDEDVRYIITAQEHADFTKLATDQQRDDYVEAFWERRNPEPGAITNNYKAEHYRRLAYANRHFAAGVPGYKTDRGHAYIAYGPPDSINDFLVGSVRFEVWHYSANSTDFMMLRFVDACDCGQFKLVDNHPQL
jgi:GWxTD domain-containing protein